MPAPRYLTHDGQTMSVTAWAKRIGISRGALDRRLNRTDASVAECLGRPVNTLRSGAALGNGCLRPDGYRVVSADNVPILEHVALAEAAIGRKLPLGAEVHHVDRCRANNAPGNLVLCPDKAYHALLHTRQEAMDATGDPNKRRCKHCKQFDDIAAMAVRGAGNYVHLKCERITRNTNRAKRKEKSCQVQI